MELTYEVVEFSRGFEVYLKVMLVVPVFCFLGLWLMGAMGGEPVSGFFMGFMGGLIVLLIFYLAPQVYSHYSRDLKGIEAALEEVYDEVDFDGDRFMTGSKDGYFVKATVTKLGDNKILVQEYE